mgnify:CR=1 FL=1
MDDIANITPGTAVVFIGLVFAVWAYLTQDLKPLLILALGVGGFFIIYTIQYILGKGNQ